MARPIVAPPIVISSTRPCGNSRTSSALLKFLSSALSVADCPMCGCACPMVVSLFLLGRDDPVLDRLLAVLQHHDRGVELGSADGAAPHELAVLGAHRL